MLVCTSKCAYLNIKVERFRKGILACKHLLPMNFKIVEHSDVIF